MKYLAGAIAFAVVVFAVMFRYEYTNHTGLDRVDRWTGKMETMCLAAPEPDWLSVAQCEEMRFGKR
ncbi:hypothetical protein NDR89_20400 [Cupriavidus gilardii]|uniref:Uncharacterized protein n=1 Tax=Cupriavidus gilardii TaxID=82541 RepID=A0ABY4VP37_9BURK|nr:hypothetical protein [Cupriavidus gilardii]USE79000.1 hypothetical protein NDR89_20400 [Cupriavidus gilardii]